MVLALAGLFGGAGPAAAARPKPTINLEVKDAEVRNILALLADVGRVNLVVSDEVGGQVTLRLKAVPWDAALEVVLRAKGLGLERVGDVIFIDTVERLAESARLRGERARLSEAGLEEVTVLFPLSYARAGELVALVQAIVGERGKVTADLRTNTLVVTAPVVDVERVKAALGQGPGAEEPEPEAPAPEAEAP